MRAEKISRKKIGDQKKISRKKIGDHKNFKNFFCVIKKNIHPKKTKGIQKKLLKFFCKNKTGGARRRRIRAAPSSSPPTGERAAQGGLRPPHPGEADPAAATSVDRAAAAHC